jgi:Kdo2-lipid IVA lauroyltransferase/acyltransferase
MQTRPPRATILSTIPPLPWQLSSSQGGPPARARLCGAPMLMFAFRALALLPLRTLHVLGATAGWIAYLDLTGAARAHARQPCRRIWSVANSCCGGPSPKAASSCSSWPGSGRARWIKSWRACKPPIPRCSRPILRQDRPILMLTPHLGCFEVIAQSYMAGPAGRARPMLALYREPRKAALRPLFAQARARSGLLLAPADLHGVRLMLRAMRDRQVVGLLPDQVPSRGEGVWAPFFGRPAFTMTLPARLARAHDAHRRAGLCAAAGARRRLLHSLGAACAGPERRSARGRRASTAPWSS